jgi:hypothetical protein
MMDKSLEQIQRNLKLISWDAQLQEEAISLPTQFHLGYWARFDKRSLGEGEIIIFFSKEDMKRYILGFYDWHWIPLIKGT